MAGGEFVLFDGGGGASESAMLLGMPLANLSAECMLIVMISHRDSRCDSRCDKCCDTCCDRHRDSRCESRQK